MQMSPWRIVQRRSQFNDPKGTCTPLNETTRVVVHVCYETSHASYFRARLRKREMQKDRQTDARHSNDPLRACNKNTLKQITQHEPDNLISTV